MEACATFLIGEPKYAGLVGVALRASLLFDDGGWCAGRSVDRDVYPLRASLGSVGGIVGLCLLHC